MNILNPYLHHQNPNPIAPVLGKRVEKVVRILDRRPLGLEQRELEPAEDGRDGEVEFRICQAKMYAPLSASTNVSQGEEEEGNNNPKNFQLERKNKQYILDTQTLPSPSAKAGQILLKPHPVVSLLQPAFGSENFMVRENSFVVVHEDGRHAHRHTGRDVPVAVPDRRVGDAGETVGGAVGQAEAFLHAGVEVRDGFELAQRGEGVGVWDRLAQCCAQFDQGGWVGEDVVGDGGHGEGGRFRPRD